MGLRRGYQWFGIGPLLLWIVNCSVGDSFTPQPSGLQFLDGSSAGGATSTGGANSVGGALADVSAGGIGGGAGDGGITDSGPSDVSRREVAPPVTGFLDGEAGPPEDVGAPDAGNPCPVISGQCSLFCGVIMADSAACSLFSDQADCECSCETDYRTPECHGGFDDFALCTIENSSECSGSSFTTDLVCESDLSAFLACGAMSDAGAVCADVAGCEAYCELVVPQGCEDQGETVAECMCQCDQQLRGCEAELDTFVSCGNGDGGVLLSCQNDELTVPETCNTEFVAMQNCFGPDASQ